MKRARDYLRYTENIDQLEKVLLDTEASITALEEEEPILASLWLGSTKMAKAYIKLVKLDGPESMAAVALAATLASQDAMHDIIEELTRDPTLTLLDEEPVGIH